MLMETWSGAAGWKRAVSESLRVRACISPDGHVSLRGRTRASRRGTGNTSECVGIRDGRKWELGIFELLHSTAKLPTPKSSRDPTHPIGMEALTKWFAPDGRPTISREKLRLEIFQRGLSDKGHARKKIWPYLLGVYAWDVTEDEG